MLGDLDLGGGGVCLKGEFGGVEEALDSLGRLAELCHSQESALNAKIFLPLAAREASSTSCL